MWNRVPRRLPVISLVDWAFVDTVNSSSRPGPWPGQLPLIAACTAITLVNTYAVSQLPPLHELQPAINTPLTLGVIVDLTRGVPAITAVNVQRPLSVLRFSAFWQSPQLSLSARQDKRYYSTHPLRVTSVPRLQQLPDNTVGYQSGMFCASWPSTANFYQGVGPDFFTSSPGYMPHARHRIDSSSSRQHAHTTEILLTSRTAT